jgi:hypothetical protein
MAFKFVRDLSATQVGEPSPILDFGDRLVRDFFLRILREEGHLSDGNFRVRIPAHAKFIAQGETEVRVVLPSSAAAV